MSLQVAHTCRCTLMHRSGVWMGQAGAHTWNTRVCTRVCMEPLHTHGLDTHQAAAHTTVRIGDTCGSSTCTYVCMDQTHVHTCARSSTCTPHAQVRCACGQTRAWMWHTCGCGPGTRGHMDQVHTHVCGCGRCVHTHAESWSTHVCRTGRQHTCAWNRDMHGSGTHVHTHTCTDTRGTHMCMHEACTYTHMQDAAPPCTRPHAHGADTRVRTQTHADHTPVPPTHPENTRPSLHPCTGPGVSGGVTPHRGAGGLQLQDDGGGVLELAGRGMAGGVPVGGAALAPRSLGKPRFGLGGRAGAGGGEGLELGGSGGRGGRGGLPAGGQLLLLLDDKLLLLRRRHRLRRLLQELGGLQRGVGCGDSDRGQGPPPSSAVPQPPRRPPPPPLRLLPSPPVHSGAY